MQIHGGALGNEVFHDRPAVVLHGEHCRRPAVLIRAVNTRAATDQDPGDLFVPRRGRLMQGSSRPIALRVDGSPAGDQCLHFLQIAAFGRPLQICPRRAAFPLAACDEEHPDQDAAQPSSRLHACRLP